MELTTSGFVATVTKIKSVFIYFFAIGHPAMLRNIRTLTAMCITLILTAFCHRTFPVKWVTVCFDASAATTANLIFAACAVKSAT